MSHQPDGQRSHLFDPKLPLIAPSGEERLESLLSQHGRTLMIALGAILLLLLVGYFWHAASRGRSESDYLAAYNAMEQLQSAKPGEGSLVEMPAFQTIQKLLKAYPELETRYDGPLAQLLLQHGNSQLAMTYADKALRQLSTENLPFYEEYSKTSLLIGQGNFKEAYKRASFLQKRMREQANSNAGSDGIFGQTLMVYNQLRLASLLQRLGLTTDELRAWQETQQVVSEAPADILNSYRTGQVSYADYIRAREQTLRGKSG